MDVVGPLELLRRQYLQLVDPEQLILPARELLKLPNFQRTIYESLFNESNTKYPPSERYRFRVLKRIVQALEDVIDDPDEDVGTDVCYYACIVVDVAIAPFADPRVLSPQEISDELTECLAQYMSQRITKESTAAQQKTWVTYTVSDPNTEIPSITLLEAPSLLASVGTTGFRTWEAALHLGSFLLSEKGSSYVGGNNVLELGAGTGFLSILCSRCLGANFVLATDGNQEVVTELNNNIALNNPEDGGFVQTAILQWGHALIETDADFRGQGSTFDLVIGADVFRKKTYDPETTPALIATMRDLFEIYPNVKILISATVRVRETVQDFLEICDKQGFKVSTLELPLPKFEEQVEFFITTSTPIEVFEITRGATIKDPFAVN